jgi:hypothetical protein
MIEAMRINTLYRGPLEWHYLRTKFHKYLPSGSKSISEGHTDRQTGDLIRLHSFLESSLKTDGSRGLCTLYSKVQQFACERALCYGYIDSFEYNMNSPTTCPEVAYCIRNLLYEPGQQFLIFLHTTLL